MHPNIKILLLEAQPEAAALVQRELERSDLRHALRCCGNGPDFEREAALAPPDIILSAYAAGDYGALPALGFLRRTGLDVPLILINGADGEESTLRCLREGAQDSLLSTGLDRLPLVIQATLIRWEVDRHRRVTQQALTRREEQYRLITENTRDLICLLDLEFNFIYASPSFESALGQPVEKLIGTECAALIHPEDRRAFQESFDEALFFREGRTAEMRLRHLNGTWQTFESAASYIFDSDGKPQRALLASRDTSDRKRAEREIRKLAAFPRFNPNPVLEFAADGSLSYFNDAALEMARSLKKNHPQSILPLNTATVVKLCLSTGQNKLHLDTTTNGRVLSWSFFPVMANQVVHCYAEDVTERLNLEAQLRQAQKMESVGQLAAGVAHDFNNILTIIQGHAGLINSEPRLDADLGESARQIALAAERAANLTRQLLMFSRKQIMQPQLLNFNEVTNNLSRMLRALIGEQVSLKLHTQDELPPIYADPGMMEQILVNLAVNARDAMPRGGSLAISTQFVEIDDGYVLRHPEARVGNHICLSVMDTGHGMDSATLARIFEPFFTTKEVGKGTGLGLATVYGIVKQHHGWVEVGSHVGQGTTFQVFIPVATKAAPKAAPAKAHEVPGGDETILVVEDEKALRELVQEILEKKGYRVIEACSGVEALELWKVHKDEIDLLLTDMMMPEGVSGRELAERVLQERSDLKVIYSSGYSLDVVGSDSGFQEGVNFLQKPYDPETLSQMVRDCLNSRSAPAFSP